jgi:hypothetical protein
VTIPGIQNTNADGSPLPTTFDVWGARVRSWDNGIRWNVISFVARNRGYGLIGTTPEPWGGFDAHAFTKYAAYDLHAAGLTCDTELPVTASPTSTFSWPCSRRTAFFRVGGCSVSGPSRG